jgi:hypothetical protein
MCFDLTQNTTIKLARTLAEQGCAGVARHPDYRSHSAPANLGRIAPPICPDLVSDRDTGFSLTKAYIDGLRILAIVMVRAFGAFVVECQYERP